MITNIDDNHKCIHTMDTDESLMLAINKDDYISYNKLFIRYYGRLCQYVYSLLMDKNDAEDIVQELFLNLWKNRKKIEIKENVTRYLYRMAKNMSLNFIRSQEKIERLTENQNLPHLSYENNQLEIEEFRIALYDCIDQLPKRNKEILLLHRVKGLKQKEISEKLSISIKTIKNQIWISLQKLKNCLDKKNI